MSVALHNIELLIRSAYGIHIRFRDSTSRFYRLDEAADLLDWLENHQAMKGETSDRSSQTSS
jgi:hypothetical protein